MTNNKNQAIVLIVCSGLSRSPRDSFGINDTVLVSYNVLHPRTANLHHYQSHGVPREICQLHFQAQRTNTAVE